MMYACEKLTTTPQPATDAGSVSRIASLDAERKEARPQAGWNTG